MKRSKPSIIPPRPTVYELLIKEVIPRLKTVEGEVQTVKGDVANLKDDVAGVKREVHDAGIGNGHTALLAEFLEDQAAKKKRNQAYAEVSTDIRRHFNFLTRPRELAVRLGGVLLVAALSGYMSAVFFGKLPIPWPFH